MRGISAFAALVGLLFVLALSARAQDKSITVFAAASMTDVTREIGAIFTHDTGIKVVTSFAASSALAKQIESGAPADVFICADIPWMDYLQDRNLVDEASRFNLAGNRLVLIAASDTGIESQDIGHGFDLAALAGEGRIATGDVRSVPVGRYARTALESLGAWAPAEGKFAMAENVRAALVLVARGEAVLGIVYETDARLEPGVKIVGRFPETSHPPIVYPAAATAGAKPEAAQFLAVLRSPQAKAIFERHGFTLLATPGS